MQLFENKTILITGASSGFGAAFARIFASAGARLINIARRRDRLDSLAKELKEQYGTESLSFAADVSDYDQIRGCIESMEGDFSIPNVLINNAGMARGLNPVWETPAPDWNEMIDINIKGLLNVSSLIIPRMLKANSGHIINVGSIAGHDTYPGGGVYCATKYAVTALTDTLRKELVATPLRVSLISPGMAKTEFSSVRFEGNQKKADAVYENIEPLSAQDLAEMVFFIASRPVHVNISDLVVYPTHQASVSLIHRST